MQVLLLVRATPADGAAAYTDGDVLRDIVVACRAEAGVGFRIDPGCVHAQVDRLPVEGFLASIGVQCAQQTLGLRSRRLLRSGDAEHAAEVRSEERRVDVALVSQSSTRWSQNHKKKPHNNKMS